MKKIMIISEFIAPFQAIASIRWTKISKYLKQNHDVSISIVTIDKRYKGISPDLTNMRIDKLLKKDLIYFDNYLMLPGGKRLGAYFKVKNFFHQEKTSERYNSQNEKKESSFFFKIACKNKIREKLYKLDRNLEEQMQFVIADHIFRFLKKKGIKDYDVIISSYGPIWTHLVAEKIKNKYPGICWLADFRDPYAMDYDSKKKFQKHKEFIPKYCANANYLIRVSDKFSLFEAPTQKVVDITNGFDPDEALEALPPSKFYVVYTGTIYNNLDDLSELFHAFKELMDSKSIDEKDIVFQYAGNQGDLFLEFANEWGMDYLVKDLGVVPRKKSLFLQQNAAILIMARWNTKITQYEWSGKMYEYMMAQKPIVYMMAGDVPHSMPSKDMGKLGGVCYEQCRHEETYPFLKDYILEKYQEWKKTGNVTIECDEEYKSQYAYPKIADQVWELIP